MSAESTEIVAVPSLEGDGSYDDEVDTTSAPAEVAAGEAELRAAATEDTVAPRQVPVPAEVAAGKAELKAAATEDTVAPRHRRGLLWAAAAVLAIILAMLLLPTLWDEAPPPVITEDGSGEKIWGAMPLGYEGPVEHSTFSPDNRWLAVTGQDSTVRVWNLSVPSSAPLRLEGHDSQITALAFRPDSTRLATAGLDGTVRLWDVTVSPPTSRVLGTHQDPMRAVLFSPDGRWLAAGGDDTVARVWVSSEPATDPRTLVGHQGSILVLAFSPDACRLATGSADLTARFWSLCDSNVGQGTLRGHRGPVRALAFSADGRLATGSDDARVRLWNLDNPALPTSEFSEHRGAIEVLAFSPDNALLASGSQDSTAYLWDLGQGRSPSRVLTGHDDTVGQLEFSADTRWLSTGSYDGVNLLWDLGDPGAAPRYLRGDQVSVTPFLFSPWGRWVTTVNRLGAEASREGRPEIPSPEFAFGYEPQLVQVVRPFEITEEPKYEDVLDLYGSEDPQERFVLFGFLKLLNRPLLGDLAPSVIEWEHQDVTTDRLMLYNPAALKLRRMAETSICGELPTLTSLAPASVQATWHKVERMQPEEGTREDRRRSQWFEIPVTIENSGEPFELCIARSQILTPTAEQMKLRNFQSLAVIDVQIASGNSAESPEGGGPWRISVPQGSTEIKLVALCMNKGVKWPDFAAASDLYIELDVGAEEAGRQGRFWAHLEEILLVPARTEVAALRM